jgi:hypothetical protein
MSRRSHHRDPIASGQIVTTTNPSDLGLIVREDVSAVMVRRSVPEWHGGLAAALPTPGFARSVKLGEEFDAEMLVASAFGWPAGPCLAKDLRGIHDALRRVDQGAGRAELSVTEGDECRMFHVDYYRLRLVVTYTGPGTEVAPERGLNRRALGQGAPDVEAANRAILSTTTPPLRSRPAELVLLKGARFGAGLAAVHRSPAIAGTGTARLIFKLTIE